MSVDTKLTLADLRHIAHLARLDLTAKQEEIFLPQLEAILDYFDILKEINTTSVDPTYQITGQKNILREDVIDTKRMFTQAQSLANAPQSKNGFFVTKSISKK